MRLNDTLIQNCLFNCLYVLTHVQKKKNARRAERHFGAKTPIFITIALCIIMRFLYVITLLFYCISLVASDIAISYCGFPEESPFQGSTCSPDASNRQECQESYYFASVDCYWDVDECTSVAVSTSEDPYCPSITNPQECHNAYFFGFRFCVWYETEAPSISPSSEPSSLPSQEPSDTPSNAPSPLPPEYCGLPYLTDPWALPRQLCSNATNKIDCFRSFMETHIKCYWWNGQCTSALVDTGEDAICPVVTQSQICNTVSHTLDRQCFWYEPQDPTPTPSIAPSTTPSARPSTPFPTTRPTKGPTPAPTERPQLRPVLPEFPVGPPPVRDPTPPPTKGPSVSPSTAPSAIPSEYPSVAPSKNPTGQPSASPTSRPTAGPTVSPSDEPSSSPSESPTHSPSAFPSHLPSSSPTVTPVEDIIKICRCNRQIQCLEESLEEGSPFFLCLTADSTLLDLDGVESLNLEKGSLTQLVASNATWVEGSFELQTGGDTLVSSLLINIDIRPVFFDANVARSEEILVSCQVWYSRNSLENVTSIFSFQYPIPVKNTEQVVKVANNNQDDQDAIAKATKEEQEKRKFNLRLWAPIAVVLALLIILAIKLMADLHYEQVNA